MIAWTSNLPRKVAIATVLVVGARAQRALCMIDLVSASGRTQAVWELGRITIGVMPTLTTILVWYAAN